GQPVELAEVGAERGKVGDRTGIDVTAERVVARQVAADVLQIANRIDQHVGRKLIRHTGVGVDAAVAGREIGRRCVARWVVIDRHRAGGGGRVDPPVERAAAEEQRAAAGTGAVGTYYQAAAAQRVEGRGVDASLRIDLNVMIGAQGQRG